MLSLKLTDSEQPTMVEIKQETLGMYHIYIKLYVHAVYSMLGGEGNGKSFQNQHLIIYSVIKWKQGSSVLMKKS